MSGQSIDEAAIIGIHWTKEGKLKMRSGLLKSIKLNKEKSQEHSHNDQNPWK